MTLKGEHSGGGRKTLAEKGLTAILEAERLGLIERWHEGRQLEAKAAFTSEQWKQVATLPKAKKQVFAVDLLVAGCKRGETEDLLGLKRGTIAQWIRDDLDSMQSMMNAAATQFAILELPTTMNILAELRFSNNHAVSRKAALDMARAAGKGIDAPAIPNLTVNMNGENNQFNLTTRELEEKILEAAKVLGGEAEKIAMEELHVKPIGLDARRPTEAGGSALGPSPGAPAEDRD